jgi:acyl carrier protein
MWDARFEELLRRSLPFLTPEEPVREDSSLRDFGLDSMGMVELLASMERTYQVRFVDDALDMANFATAGALWTTLEKMIDTPV